MDGFVAWLKQLQFDGVWQTAVLVAASLLCITFHETCHGLVAYWLGDPTAKRAGRLTLNPLRHVDIGGLLMMALFRFRLGKACPGRYALFQASQARHGAHRCGRPAVQRSAGVSGCAAPTVSLPIGTISPAQQPFMSLHFFSITSRSFRRDWLCSTFFLSRRSTGSKVLFPACPIKLTSGSCAMSATAWRF